MSIFAGLDRSDGSESESSSDSSSSEGESDSESDKSDDSDREEHTPMVSVFNVLLCPSLPYFYVSKYSCLHPLYLSNVSKTCTSIGLNNVMQNRQNLPRLYSMSVAHAPSPPHFFVLTYISFELIFILAI